MRQTQKAAIFELLQLLKRRTEQVRAVYALEELIAACVEAVKPSNRERPRRLAGPFPYLISHLSTKASGAFSICHK